MLLPLLLKLALAPLLIQDAAAPAAPESSSSVRAPRRVECFAIEAIDTEGAGGDSGAESGRRRVLGVALRIERERAAARDLEHTVHWFEAETSVVHVESVQARGPALVWREVRRHSGRTLLLSRSERVDGFDVVDYSGGSGAERRALPAAGLVTPLRWLELQREGREGATSARVFDPLSARTETLCSSTLRLPSLPGPALRLVSWSREDGTSAGRYLLLGTALLAYQLQDGGPVARRTSPDHRLELLRRASARGERDEAGVTQVLPASSPRLR